jgi:hypothetical protein
VWGGDAAGLKTKEGVIRMKDKDNDVLKKFILLSMQEIV